MIVYGDHAETVVACDRLAALEARRVAIGQLPPGLERHQSLVTLLIELGRFAQAVADDAFEAAGADMLSEAEQICLQLLLQVARAVTASWDSDFAVLPPLPPIVLDAELPQSLRLKLPEGYAFYAVYPECYAEAARQIALDVRLAVIGIRSIGVSLGAIVAAALGADRYWTVRPSGHPFARELQLGSAMEAEIMPSGRGFVIVDEGPGLSGSSFGCVADWLEARGVRPDRIAFLPSHDGALGPHASAAHSARWERAVRPSIAAQQLVVDDRLLSWVETLLGGVEAPLEDISGGKWRAGFWLDERAWPAVDPGQERLKYRVLAGDAPWLLKFAGLGALGERKLGHARLLHAAGFVAEPVGLLHGFLAERWIDGVPVERADDALLAFAGRYFAARATILPAGPEAGASLEELFAMARHNIGLALGDEWSTRIAPWAERLSSLEPSIRPVVIDGRCERHEWLRLRQGAFIKTDALDHHAGHDLIGCQDIAWDVAGFSIEFALDDGRQARLIAEVEAGSGRQLDRSLLAFLSLCYLAFRVGQRDMAAASLGGWPAERQRNLVARDRYADLLRQHLAPGWT